MFRRWLMNYLQARGFHSLVQIIASGLLFGLLHGGWGLLGWNLRAAVRAMAATGILGLIFAVVFVLAGRSLAPCVAAHFLVNLCVEPGLVLAALRGEMENVGHRATRRSMRS